MPLSKKEYDRMMADPARSEAARRGAVTRARNESRRRWAWRQLSRELGRVPTESEIAEMISRV